MARVFMRGGFVRLVAYALVLWASLAWLGAAALYLEGGVDAVVAGPFALVELILSPAAAWWLFKMARSRRARRVPS